MTTRAATTSRSAFPSANRKRSTEHQQTAPPIFRTHHAFRHPLCIYFVIPVASAGAESSCPNQGATHESHSVQRRCQLACGGGRFRPEPRRGADATEATATTAAAG